MSVRQADVSQKPVSYRYAVATGRIRLKPETIRKIKRGELAKGDALGIAETMAVLAAKRTPDLLALCHPLKIELTQVSAKLRRDSVEVTVMVTAHEKTGVEMEALTAVSVALLNIWDVTKAYEKDEMGQYPGTKIDDLHVVRKVKRS